MPLAVSGCDSPLLSRAMRIVPALDPMAVLLAATAGAVDEAAVIAATATPVVRLDLAVALLLLKIPL